MADESSIQGDDVLGVPGSDLSGYSRTAAKTETETILSEVEGFRIVIRRTIMDQPSGGGQIEFCQRCIVDIATNTELCFRIPCPPPKA